MKRTSFLLTLLLVAIFTFAQNQQPRRGVPATPHPIEYVQPNGDTLVFRLIGDEHFHYRMTLDGYLIKQNKKGYYCYAKYNKKGETVCTCRKAHNAEKRSKCEQRYIEKNIPNKIKEREQNDQD